MNNSQQANISVSASLSATSRGIAQIVVESCIFVVLNITVLVGNVLVCLAWYRNPSLRTVTNIFILSLALTDLLMAVLVMPLATASSIANKWVAGHYGCEIQAIGSHLLGGTSLLTVALLAVNRYFRVVSPERYANIYSKKRSTAMAVSVWIVTAVISSVYYFLAGIQYRIYPVNPTAPMLVFPKTNSKLFLRLISSVYISFPSAVIALCYARIYRTILQHNTAATPSSQEGPHSAYGVDEKKMTRLLTVVLVGFHICWLPVFITTIFYSVQEYDETGIKYSNLYYIFPLYTSSVINPIIYATMSQPFRKEFLKIFRGL